MMSNSTVVSLRQPDEIDDPLIPTKPPGYTELYPRTVLI